MNEKSEELVSQSTIEVLFYWLSGIRYHLKRNQITKAYWLAYYCCEVLDEELEKFQ